MASLNDDLSAVSDSALDSLGKARDMSMTEAAVSLNCMDKVNLVV